MAFYMEDEEVWRCPKHPSKRRRTGVCPTCLRERLATLCPDCANVRPCSCCPTSSSSSSSNSSSFSLFSLAGDSAFNRVHNLFDGDSNAGLKRSRSVAIPFLRSKSRYNAAERESDHGGAAAAAKDPAGLSKSRSARWLLSMFKPPKSNRKGEAEQDSDDGGSVNQKSAMMMRSKSVAVSGGGELRGTKKWKGWYFPSPMKAFRQSNKPSNKVLQEAVACA